MTSYDENYFGVLPVFEREKTNLLAPPFETSQTSSRKRTSTVWEDFERVFVNRVWKAKCKKYAKFYSYTSNGGTDHLKRYQESHRMSDSHLQSILNV